MQEYKIEIKKIIFHGDGVTAAVRFVFPIKEAEILFFLADLNKSENRKAGGELDTSSTPSIPTNYYF